MYANWSLQNRLATMLAVSGGMVSLALASIIYIASADLEARLIDDTLTAELDDFVARRERNPLSLPERTATIRAYVVTDDGDKGQVPEEVRKLEPGSHTLTLDSTSYHAGVRDVDNQRYVVLYDTSALSQRESGFLLLLFVSVMLVTLVFAMSGRWLAARVIAPVNELVRRVSELDPEDEPTPLAEAFPWVEVRKLAEDFDVYLARLHDFIERERLFTGDVSHELRTPLAVINGATQLLLNDEDLDERNRKRVTRIARAVSDMGEITAALLALAREQGNTSSRFVEYDVETVAREVIEHYQELFHHKPVTVLLEVQSPLTVRVDHAILSMVLGNLLRNALSFTEKGQVVVRIARNSIQVEDTGPGLGTDDPEKLFQPYVRGQHNHSGAGLGLSLVWRLCKLTGWRISLANRPEGGTLTQLWLVPESISEAQS